MTFKYPIKEVTKENLMKKHTIWKCLTLFTCVLAGSVLPAAALEKGDFDFKTTRHLYNLCSVSQDHGDYAAASYACKGFIAGTVQYHDGISDEKNLKRLICYPANTTLADGKTAFVAWAETNVNDADLMGELPVLGLVRALAEAYPCGK